jgi:outer membrane protein TolC
MWPIVDRAHILERRLKFINYTECVNIKMKMTNKSFFLIVVALFVAMSCITSANAATWQQVSDLAVNNDDYVSASKQLDSAEWSYKKAWTNFFPQLSASAGYSETVVPEDMPKSYSLGLSASQTLFKGFQNLNALKTAYSNYQYYLAGFNKARSDVYYNLRTAFVGLYISQENLDLAQQILTRIKENARMIKLRYDSGREDKGNLLTTVASQRDAEYGVASAKRALELSKLKISQLISSEVKSTDGTIDISLEADPDMERLTEAAPSYLMAKYQLENSDIAAQNTLGEFLPTVSASYSYRKNGEDWPPDTLGKSWGVNVSMPLFPGGSNIADKYINDINFEKAKRDFESNKKDLRYNIGNAYSNAKNALDSLEVKKAQLSAANERSKIADAKYQNGLITFDEWNRITNDNITAQKNLLQGKRSALESVAAWKNSYGGY